MKLWDSLKKVFTKQTPRFALGTPIQLTKACGCSLRFAGRMGIVEGQINPNTFLMHIPSLHAETEIVIVCAAGLAPFTTNTALLH